MSIYGPQYDVLMMKAGELLIVFLQNYQEINYKVVYLQLTKARDCWIRWFYQSCMRHGSRSYFPEAFHVNFLKEDFFKLNKNAVSSTAVCGRFKLKETIGFQCRLLNSKQKNYFFLILFLNTVKPKPPEMQTFLKLECLLSLLTNKKRNLHMILLHLAFLCNILLTVCMCLIVYVRLFR